MKARKPGNGRRRARPTRRFNEAAPVKARKHERTTETEEDRWRSFNEAAPVKARKRAPPARPAPAEPGFNEAAPVKARKPALYSQTAPLLRWLQRGRAGEGAEAGRP